MLSVPKLFSKLISFNYRTTQAYSLPEEFIKISACVKGNCDIRRDNLKLM